MFTGIIQHTGTLRDRQRHAGDQSLAFSVAKSWLANTVVGDSIAVNGVCLTVTDFNDDGFCADVSAETLTRTTLGHLATGAPVNLEHALRANDALGGHLVSGHVDTVAAVQACHRDSRSERIWISLPAELSHLVAVKGNICVDGTSLTVNEVEVGRFGVNIVPHTIGATIAGSWQAGALVNLEVDLIARYVARMLDISNGQGAA